MSGYGAMLQAVGMVANTAGEMEGTRALQHQKRRELADSVRFDAQRQRRLGRYIDTLGPGMQTTDAAATEGALRANGAAGANAAGAQALGVQPGMPITAASRAGVRQAGFGRRLLGDEINQMGLDSDLGEVERHRNDAALLYEEQERRAAKKGSSLRMFGSLLGAGGQGVSAYEMMGSKPAASQQQQTPPYTVRVQDRPQPRTY